MEVACDELKTVEIFEWEGLTVLCDYRSVCSQKVLTALLIKRIDFTFKKIDVQERENRSDFFMGVNPRGVIPALVHDGRVLVESVEIMKYIDQTFEQGPCLYPEALRPAIDRILKWEDALHLHRRNFTHGGYMIPTHVNLMKWYSPEQLEKWLRAAPDVKSCVKAGVSQGKDEQYRHWMMLFASGGAGPEMLRESAAKWHEFYSHINELLEKSRGQEFILGRNITAADIVTVITVHRMAWAGDQDQTLPLLLDV